ncbi:hypothetical protein COW81_02575 [Candidatus Campbellbacteria bacterium CG22_combo_CG10-13_8_21_14_all_36_13]|uniref:Methyltransferase domain-containing protein n=1 Tax=Candidatus Campbellbacteria bacterium CG22_combo_CG10-13_8_21_14_all_36_13 TaxID=1974529 RepID=A0A2H0DXW3_9BACT|nr:MAG: hypothetical protein COW81_02575 [Candidatus Campbellbacteria bacterium CG22_combo_CG10-13_8_21_14_all_36_13]
MLDNHFWRKYFKVYDVLNHVIPYQEMLDMVVESLNIKQGDLILDAGAGTGNLAIKMHGKGAKVIAFDSSTEGLEIYKNKFDEAVFICGNLEDKLPFEDNLFDHIYSVNTLHFIASQKRENVCKEFNRVLKQGGNIALVSLSEGYRPMLIYKDHVKKHYISMGFWYTVKHLFHLVIPTIKMFYYGLKIKRHTKSENDGKLMIGDEQFELLENTGFKNIKPTNNIFANQAVINIAVKL